MTDFSVPQRMSLSAFPIMFVKTLNDVAGIFALAIVVRLFDSDTDYTDMSMWTRILVGVGICLAVVLLLTVGVYFTKKFYVKDGNLIFIHGLIKRQVFTIPLDKVHTLRTKRGVIYRILDMRGVTFDTLASKVEEIELILDESDWQSLIRLIEKEESPQPVADSGRQADTGRRISFGNKYLVLDALCQNHLKGAAILGGFIAMIFEQISDISDSFVEDMVLYASMHTDEVELSSLYILSGLAVVYAIVLALWLGKVVMRYYDMSLRYDKTLLSFSYGMFSRLSCRLSFDKVCTIWVKRNFLEKYFGLSTIALRQAFNATKYKEEDNLKLYGLDRSAMFLEWWLGDGYASEPELLAAKSGRGLLTRIVVPALAISVAAVWVLCYYSQYVWIIVPVVYFIVTCLNGGFALWRSRITLRETYFVVENGHFADIKNYIKYDNVEVVRIARTPLTRWFHRVTLTVSTPGTTLNIRSLKEDEAMAIYEELIGRSLLRRSA